jgi:hypothetical protein
VPDTPLVSLLSGNNPLRVVLFDSLTAKIGEYEVVVHPFVEDQPHKISLGPYDQHGALGFLKNFQRFAERSRSRDLGHVTVHNRPEIPFLAPGRRLQDLIAADEPQDVYANHDWEKGLGGDNGHSAGCVDRHPVGEKLHTIFGDHRVASGYSHHILFRLKPDLLLNCGEEDQKCDHEQNRLLTQHRDDSDRDAQHLADTRGDRRSVCDVAEEQERAQNSPTIHREGRDHVKDPEYDIGNEEPSQDRVAAEEREERVPIDPEGQREGQKNVYEWSGERDEKLRQRIRILEQNGHSSEWVERDLPRSNTEKSRRQYVTKFVQEDAAKQPDNKEQLRKGRVPTSRVDPDQEQEKRGVKPKRDPPYGTQIEGPEIGAAGRGESHSEVGTLHRVGA